MPYGSAITFGNWVTTYYSEAEYYSDPRLPAHEHAHTSQWLIPGFGVAYLAFMPWSMATTGDWFCGNPFEGWTGTTEGYERCGWDSPVEPPK
jgi:hypothetical protein